MTRDRIAYWLRGYHGGQDKATGTYTRGENNGNDGNSKQLQSSMSDRQSQAHSTHHSSLNEGSRRRSGLIAITKRYFNLCLEKTTGYRENI